LDTNEYPPPPPPDPELVLAVGHPPPPPPPTVSIVFEALFQSPGTVHVVPEVRKTTTLRTIGTRSFGVWIQKRRWTCPSTVRE